MYNITLPAYNVMKLDEMYLKSISINREITTIDNLSKCSKEKLWKRLQESINRDKDEVA